MQHLSFYLYLAKTHQQKITGSKTYHAPFKSVEKPWSLQELHRPHYHMPVAVNTHHYRKNHHRTDADHSLPGSVVVHYHTEAPAGTTEHSLTVPVPPDRTLVGLVPHTQLDWWEVAHKPPDLLVVSGLEVTVHSWLGLTTLTVHILTEM